jgi:hypothetical protein
MLSSSPKAWKRDSSWQALLRCQLPAKNLLGEFPVPHRSCRKENPRVSPIVAARPPTRVGGQGVTAQRITPSLVLAGAAVDHLPLNRRPRLDYK